MLYGRTSLKSEAHAHHLSTSQVPSFDDEVNNDLQSIVAAMEFTDAAEQSDREAAAQVADDLDIAALKEIVSGLAAC